MPRRPRSASKARIKQKLIEQFGEVCNEPGCTQTKQLTIDHVVPIARGGSNSMDNLQLLCQRHNKLKADRLAGESASRTSGAAAKRRARRLRAKQAGG